MNPPENQRDVEVPVEAIEMAAEAMYEADRSDAHERWEGGAGIMLSDEHRDAYRSDARRALQAAAPVLCAQAEKRGEEEAETRLYAFFDDDEFPEAQIRSKLGAETKRADDAEGDRDAAYKAEELANRERDQAAQKERERVKEALLGWVRSQIAEDEGCLKRETDDSIRAEYNGSLEALNEVEQKIAALTTLDKETD